VHTDPNKHQHIDLISHLDSSFNRKKDLTETLAWCEPIPISRKISTIQDFMQDFYNQDSLETNHCRMCYQSRSNDQLKYLSFSTIERYTRAIAKREIVQQLLRCTACFPRNNITAVPICHVCTNAFAGGEIPRDCSLNNAFLDCVHSYPDELRDLSPVEEKLISINTAFGIISRFSIERGLLRGVEYRKRVKGHITVFINDIEGLCSNVLPHPLLDVMKLVHVTWSGSEKPKPKDVSKMLKVRKHSVLGALRWLKQNNRLYNDIKILSSNMEDIRYVVDTEVPELVYDAFVHTVQTAEERIAESTIDTVQSTQDKDEAEVEHSSIEVVADLLLSGNSGSGDNDVQVWPNNEGDEDDGRDDADDNDENPLTITSTAMFHMDGEEASCDKSTRFQFIKDALTGFDIPYIQASREGKFADSLDPDFFMKTFPVLFPRGIGGPKDLEGVQQEINTSSRMEFTDGTAAVKTRGFSLKEWSKLCLNRHGSLFSKHPVFAYLIFDIILRANINRISMVKMAPSNLARVQSIFQSLTPEMVQTATEELQKSNQTTISEVRRLLIELSLYFYSQPLSNESRLLMRRRIRSLCLSIGLPAIWFTINPNDLTNPIKLHLSAYHSSASKADAEQLLKDIETSPHLQRIFLAQSTLDPVSAVQYFQREIQMFFKHYVQPGKDSIFGRVSHYYATVETNNRGALHLHGLMWLEGNLDLPDLCMAIDDPSKPGYEDKVIAFVDSIFTEGLQNSEATVKTSDGKLHTVDPRISCDPDFLQTHFDEEAYFVANKTQIHRHSPTCVKYSYSELKTANRRHENSDRDRQPCRFNAPWPLVETTHFAEGSLKLARNHSLVNRFNKSMAIGLRHNHDITLISSKSNCLAIIYYTTNYATKLETPTWKRAALALEVLQYNFDNESRSIQEQCRGNGEAGNLSHPHPVS
jgi:hypothetical protein